MKRPPITGMPTERPLCPYCGRKLRPVTRDTWGREPEGGMVLVARAFERWSCYQGLWCRLQCALDFATLAHRAGYRMRRRAS